MSCLCSSDSIHNQDNDNLKILFIGSSYFNSNNLPEIFENLAHSGGRDVFIDTRIINGTYLTYHAMSHETEDKIKQEKWDYVVLQGVGTLMAYPDIITHHPVYPALETLKEKISTNSEETKMMFCLPWAFEDGMTWVEGWTDTFSDMQNKINTTTLEYADVIGFIVAPVGVAWQKVLDEKNYPLHYLHRSDWNHPSLRGTYLMACVIYATIYNEYINDFSYLAGLPENEALYFQTIASSVVLNDLDQWLILDKDYSSTNAKAIKLQQNHPNPFNPSTLITYELTKESMVSIKIYNSLGNEIKTVINEFKPVGKYQANWNGTDDLGEKVSGGTYFFQLRAGSLIQTRKMVLLK